jgi:hypothetical protein
MSVDDNSLVVAPTCPICLEKFDNDTEALLCGHVFHTVCLNIWLATSNTCPICRTTVNGAPPPRRNTSDDDVLTQEVLSALYNQLEGTNFQNALWSLPTPLGTFVMQAHPDLQRHILVRYTRQRRPPPPAPRRPRFRDRLTRFLQRFLLC